MTKTNRTVSWNNYLFLHSLRLIPEKDRLQYLTETNREFLTIYRKLQRRLKREPTWGEIGQAARISSPPSIANHLFRLRTAGLVPDVDPEFRKKAPPIPTDLVWGDAFSRLLDLVGSYADSYPDDPRGEMIKETVRLLGMPPKLPFPEAPAWYRQLHNETYRAEEEHQMRQPGTYFMRHGARKRKSVV